MLPEQLFDSLIDRGFTLTCEGDALYVQPRNQLQPDDVEAIRAAKPGLLALVVRGYRPTGEGLGENLDPDLDQFLARIRREKIETEADKYGPRLSTKMSESLYVALALYRRERFMQMKSSKPKETEEE